MYIIYLGIHFTSNRSKSVVDIKAAKADLQICDVNCILHEYDVLYRYEECVL